MDLPASHGLVDAFVDRGHRLERRWDDLQADGVCGDREAFAVVGGAEVLAWRFAVRDPVPWVRVVAAIRVERPPRLALRY